MPDPSFRTVQMQALLDRMRAGDKAARDELFGRVAERLERLARKMLRGFPGVARWEQTGDILDPAMMRLLQALETVTPESVRAFFGLAAEQMRRTLIDRARHYQGPHGLGANHASNVTPPMDLAEDTPDQADTLRDLERWSAFHVAVDALPEEEREVFSLLFYHGLTQPEAADLLKLSTRTVRRQWAAACVRLREALRGDFPQR
jgi:RNA polymerase sigma-70 factor (ECF subfamily)